jgi:hypothetical protein
MSEFMRGQSRFLPEFTTLGEPPPGMRNLLLVEGFSPVAKES